MHGDFKLPPLRLASHPVDTEAIAIHDPGLQHMPHEHLIRDDWTVAHKNAAGDHIDRWHFRSRDYSGDR